MSMRAPGDPPRAGYVGLSNIRGQARWVETRPVRVEEPD
jgi:hypothetical protein